MKEIVKLDQTFITMVDKVIIDIPAIERHLDGVIQMFLQFDKEYLILPLGIMIELDEYIDTKRSQRYLVLAERKWMFKQRQLWQF
jgi:hypothetical protein